ncbi:MAG TPA: O-antigen ligase family protein [Opitutaceae bacterium]|jgi:hypothetical protein
MNPSLRVGFFLAAGVILGITLGVGLSEGDYGLAILVAAVAFWIVVERASAAPPDAWLLGATIVGYVVGNRGFAQIQPTAQVPLLPAEAVLLVTIPALVVRMVVRRAPGFRPDALNITILAWLLYGTIRLPFDLSRFGIMALRDYAMIYYAAFFYVGQAFGAHGPSARALRRSLTIAFAVLLPVVISIQLFPTYLLEHFTWRGIPIIYQKSDLIATSLAAGFFWLWTRRRTGQGFLWPATAAASVLLIGIMASPRAAMAALAVTAFLWLLAGRWRIVAALAGIVSGGGLVAFAVVSFSGQDVRTSAPYSIYEHAVSIFDPEGAGTYVNAESGDPGDNNRFRLIWWRDVCEETLGTSPVLGLGFGADLAARFLADYDLLSDETFAARSPHSIAVTVFGRMGFVGLAVWIALSASMARVAWRLLRRGDPDGLGLASIACVIWISACVGVVLESPMGAVIFWTVLGMASACAARALAEVPKAEAAASRVWPVAKAGVFDTQSDTQ